MPAAGTKPDINALLDAYAALGVEHSANPAEIRQAYKQAARRHHPDRHPAGSPAQHEATERMVVINAAYQLVRDAPLRHHRVSTGSNPDVPWDDTELDEAFRRARYERVFSNVASIAGVLIFAFFVPWLVSGLVRAAGLPLLSLYLGTAIFCVAGIVAVMSGNLGAQVWRAIVIVDALVLASSLLKSYLP